MNDLLTDSFEKARGPRMRDVEFGNGFSPDASEIGMVGFFEKVGEIEIQIDRISSLLQKLQDASEESKSVLKASIMKEIKERMEKDVDQVGGIARSTKVNLEGLDRDNLENRQQPGCGRGTSVDRSRMSMAVALKKKLKDKMTDFQTLRQTIQDEYREVVERRVFTVTGASTDEETIDHLIETGHVEQIFQKAINNQGRGMIMDTLDEIQERHDAVRELDKRLLHLQQMFLDMAVLVEAQGDMVDDIEAQVSRAVDHVQTATAVIHKAKRQQRNTRKWACIAISILLFIIIIALVPILNEFKPWLEKSKNP
ncbi:hypothetical protein AMTRI_Chr07g75370 [Amborella trichopoda]